MTQTNWWWVRHAPVTETQGRIYGSTDPNCDTDDPESYAGLHRMLPQDAFWVTSHLKRTKQTAAAIAAAGGRSIDPREEPDLCEQNFGDWHGMTHNEVYALPSAHRFWLAPATHCPPGGESFADLCVRVSRVIHRLTAQWAGRDIIAVAHGGTIRAALAVALNLKPEAALGFATENISVTRLDHFTGDDGHPETWRVAWSNRLPK
ncbi:MAG: histidine phosphatase family protein [Proteobacteria bacterium]|nr:histidine phosphatase family protein [Pseudomonadota bacterium]MDA1070087.1 histidine phosphatase family protein [Pseudomonadota bacterium]